MMPLQIICLTMVYQLALISPQANALLIPENNDLMNSFIGGRQISKKIELQNELFQRTVVKDIDRFIQVVMIVPIVHKYLCSLFFINDTFVLFCDSRRFQHYSHNNQSIVFRFILRIQSLHITTAMHPSFVAVTLLFALSCALTPVVQCNGREWSEGVHDKHCYTQGFSFVNSTHVLQTCGLYGSSYFQIHEYNAESNALVTVYKSKVFPRSLFFEGSIYFPSNGIFYILTWQERVVLRYRYNKEKGVFEDIGNLKWFSQGWGMTHNNTHIFITDGSNHMYVTDEFLTIKQILKIKDQKGAKLVHINQLEWHEQNGQQFIYANVYGKSNIYKISIAKQTVVEQTDLKKLEDEQWKWGTLKSDEVMNGIAISGGKMLVTGKDWPAFYAAKM